MMSQRTPPERVALEEASTRDLMREVLDEAKELVRLEVQLARGEITRELRRAKVAAIGFGAAAALVLVGIALLFVAIPLAFTNAWIASLVVGGILVGLAGTVALAGYVLLPRRPLEQTRERLVANVRQLKEHVV